MKHPLKTLAAGVAVLAISNAAHAADFSKCEVLLVQIIQADDATSEARIASYRPAENFLKSVQDDIPGHMTQIDGQNIQAILCSRNEVIPAESDYAVISAGIPFILSQDFDSTDTDSLTIYWKDGKIEHVYKGYPLSEEAQSILDTRLAAFSERGLSATAHETAEIAAKIKAKNELTKQQNLSKISTPTPEAEDIIVTNTGTRDKTRAHTQIEIEVEANSKPTEDTASAIEIEDATIANSKTPNATQLNIQTEIEIEE